MAIFLTLIVTILVTSSVSGFDWFPGSRFQRARNMAERLNARRENPYGTTEEVPLVMPESRIECTAAFERERCLPILHEAFAGSSKGLRPALHHYCRNIPDFIPCIEENRENIITLMNCSRSDLRITMMEQFNYNLQLTLAEQLDMSINAFNIVENILCSRTDEIADMILCIEKKDTLFQPQLEMCITSEVQPLIMAMMDPDYRSDLSTVCSTIYGFISCMKSGITRICGAKYTDLLDTAYDEVIVGVVGETLGCEGEADPLMSLFRSMRDKYRH